eukprot:scaffold76356_cov71-Phaeocystis_antarctica.AAC.1
MKVLKVARDGTQTTRLTARGAIAVTATHGAQGRACLAPKHTKQVAVQARPSSTALCGAPHVVRPAPPRSMRANLRHAAQRHDREGSIAEPPGPERAPTETSPVQSNLRRMQRINSQDER